MSDLKVTFDKLNKACKEANEKWKKMTEENNPFDAKSNITKDIADKRDKEMALEFAKYIGELFRENGVTAIIEEYRPGPTLKDKNLIEEYYGVAIAGLDFTEHDKRFKDEITQLKHDTKEMEDKIAELESELEVKDNLLKIKNGLCGNNDELPIDPIEVAQMLINSTFEREASNLEKVLYKCGDTRITERYSIDDLEQIAEHLFVYCKHNREDDE